MKPSKCVIIRSLVSFAYLSLVTCIVEETTTKEDSDIHYVADDSSFNDKTSEGGGSDIDITENVKRAFDSDPPDENKVFKNDQSGGGDKPNNIQRVPPKSMGLVEALMATSESEAPFSNVTASDVQWLARIFNVLRWAPENIPGGKLVDTRCSSLMQRYLIALRSGALWASKSEYLWARLLRSRYIFVLTRDVGAAFFHFLVPSLENDTVISVSNQDLVQRLKVQKDRHLFQKYQLFDPLFSSALQNSRQFFRQQFII